MKRAFLKFLYLRYTALFNDFMVEDLIGQVPKDIREPSVAFLARGKDVLTRYFLFQAYSLQRRSVADVDNAERFHGMLIILKFFISLLDSAQPREILPSLSEEKKEDPTKAIDEFAKGMRELRKPKT